jgi:hypothetical protein
MPRRTILGEHAMRAAIDATGLAVSSDLEERA